MLYDRKELSGQKRCRPAQVLGENKETVGPIVTLDGYFSILFGDQEPIWINFSLTTYRLD